jgi:hypothetical protein
MNIRNLIKEELGVSKFAEEALERLEIEKINLDFEKERKRTIMVSDALIKLDEIFFDLELYITFVDEEARNYPIYNASVEIDYADSIIKITLELHESYRHNNTTQDIFKNDIIKSSLIHELHHLIRDSQMKKQRGYESRVEKTNPFFCYIFDIFEYEDKKGNKKVKIEIGKWGYPSQELINFYYYLSKSELGSVVPEFKYIRNANTISMFRKFEGMSYPEFSKYIQDNHNGRTPTNKEYKNVKKRVRYFFDKIRKLGVSE